MGDDWRTVRCDQTATHNVRVAST